MSDNSSTLRELREQIERTDAQTERECASFLREIAWVLLARIDGEPKYVSCDQTCSVGSVDMIVLAEAWGVGIKPYLQAYVWELKAPQLSLFQMETNSRACPTYHLYSAENQLLHYYDAVRKDGALLQRMDIVSGDYVHLGGIIIGQDTTYLKSDRKKRADSMSCAEQSERIRNMYFYQDRIQLWTWDRVIDFATSVTAGFQTKVKPYGPTDLSASRPSPEVIYTDPPTTDLPSAS